MCLSFFMFRTPSLLAERSTNFFAMIKPSDLVNFHFIIVMIASSSSANERITKPQND